MTNFSRMLGGFLLTLVGLYLTPAVGTAATDAAGNVSGGAEKAIIGLVTIFWVVAVIAAAAAVAGLKIGK